MFTQEMEQKGSPEAFEINGALQKQLQQKRPRVEN
jgi:hypothetical protein